MLELNCIIIASIWIPCYNGHSRISCDIIVVRKLLNILSKKQLEHCFKDIWYLFSHGIRRKQTSRVLIGWEFEVADAVDCWVERCSKNKIWISFHGILHIHKYEIILYNLSPHFHPYYLSQKLSSDYAHSYYYYNTFFHSCQSLAFVSYSNIISTLSWCTESWERWNPLPIWYSSSAILSLVVQCLIIVLSKFNFIFHNNDFHHIIFFEFISFSPGCAE